MPQQTSANVELAEISATDAPVAPRLETQTALECLAKVAAHHGIDLPAERLRHAYAVDGAPISQVLLSHGEGGGTACKGHAARLGRSLSVGSGISSTRAACERQLGHRVGAGERSDGEGMVSVIDPLAERSMSRWLLVGSHFARNGKVRSILIKREP